jgi:hypothetical protein|tara:strand:- start:146 stop:481 length:336 start_codon:yes stop_codon:yes gene_type:complete
LIILSCEKEDHLVIPNHEIVLIDMTNGDTYHYSNLETPELGWIEMANGEGTYTFTIVDKEIVLKSLKAIATAKYYEDTFDRQGRKLEVGPNNEIQMLAEKENLIFEFTYSN